MLSCLVIEPQPETVNSEMFHISLSHVLKGSLDQHTLLVAHLINAEPSERTVEHLVKVDTFI